MSKYLEEEREEGGGEGGEEQNESHTCISMQYHTAPTAHSMLSLSSLLLDVQREGQHAPGEPQRAGEGARLVKREGEMMAGGGGAGVGG